MMEELRIARSNIVCLIDEAWELGGYCIGEEQFEAKSNIKDARECIERIDRVLNKNY